jgi:uncharacterized membrane protein
MKTTRTAGVCRTAHIQTHLTVIDLFSLIRRCVMIVFDNAIRTTNRSIEMIWHSGLPRLATRRFDNRRRENSMHTPASIRKHPIHPMLIVFPIGLGVFSLACDLIRLAGASGDTWATVALVSMVGGFIGALCAAGPGFIDLLYYKGGAPRVKNIALTHMTINLIAVVLYAVNIWLRVSNPSSIGPNISTPVILSIIGVALLCVSGWLGGQMVHVYGVGVEGRE